jgi:uncharacterized membrane protein (UPF0127 family)
VAVLVNATRDKVIARNVVRANSEVERTVGFLRKSRVGDDDGIWFPRCNLIHTIGMRARIDVVFVDDAARVLRVVNAAPPWRILSGGSRASHAIELAPGIVERSGLALGDLLVLDDGA